MQKTIVVATVLFLVLGLGLGFAQEATPTKTVDINTASKEELMTFKGVGPAIADRIIAGRPYQTVDDLLKVSGIGKAKLETIKTSGAVASQER